MTTSLNLQEIQPNQQQLAIQNPHHTTNHVATVPKDLLSFMFRGLNAQDFSNLRLVSKGWRNVVIDPIFAKNTHWYPELAKICMQLSKNIDPETFSQAFNALQSILTSPEPLHFEAYKDKLILKLDLLPKDELVRLSALNLPLPAAYKNIMQSAMKIYHSFSPEGGKTWSPYKEMASINTCHEIFNLTGVNLSPHEAFVSFRVGYGVIFAFSNYSELDKSIPEMFPISVLQGKSEGDILDFKLIDGKRYLHTLSGNRGEQLEDTLLSVEQLRVNDLSPQVLGHVLLPDLLDQLKVSTANIAGGLMTQINASKYPDFKGKMLEFHERIKTLESMPDLDMLKEELKAHLSTIDTEDLTKVTALTANRVNPNIMGLPSHGIVRIPEGWETIVKEIVEERKG